MVVQSSKEEEVKSSPNSWERMMNKFDEIIGNLTSEKNLFITIVISVLVCLCMVITCRMCCTACCKPKEGGIEDGI